MQKDKCAIKRELISLIENMFDGIKLDLNIVDEMNLIDELVVSSILFVAFIVEIENQFDITLPDDVILMERFQNINDIVDIVFNSIGGSCD